LTTTEDIEELEHYLKEVSEKLTPYGLHTFGVVPSASLRASTAEAILSLSGKLSSEDYARRKTELMSLIEQSAGNELDALVAGLNGRHIAAGPGGDPIRNPDALPTGRNLYGFDPARLPTPATWAQGQALAEHFVADYKRRHGLYPDRVTFNLWSIETMRHEGITESEILALLGVRPVWDERGRATGVTVIPREALGRPRVDVTMIPTGLYRDALPNLMQVLDEAVSKVKDLDEEDNPIRANVKKTTLALAARGIGGREAARMAAVRLFTEAAGVYGAGIEEKIQASATWRDESEVSDVFFSRIGHLYGQGYWGDQPGGKSLAVDLFKMALTESKAVIHSRSSNVYGVLDNDDNFQYLGGTAMAIRQVSGKTPETFLLNLAQGKEGRHETLDKYMGREMRSRYTNPEWVKSMLKEGYAGARLIKTVTDNLWGWQVTVPEAVDGAKWQEMYETYVADRNQLGVREKFREAKNLLAYQAMVDKMLVAINKGYWKADPKVKAHLDQVNHEVIAEAGVACNASSCSSPEITAQVEAQDRKAMLEAKAMPLSNISKKSAVLVVAEASPHPSSAAQPKAMDNTPPPLQPTDSSKAIAQVDGYEMKEQKRSENTLPSEVAYGALAGFACLVLFGFFWNARRRT
jgi:cobaltochelatase CobN